MVSHHQALKNMTIEAFFTRGAKMYRKIYAAFHILVVTNLLIFRRWENVIHCIADSISFNLVPNIQIFVNFYHVFHCHLEGEVFLETLHQET